MAHKKRVRIFRQNASMETCVCCCVLMLLDYYRLLPGGMDHPTGQYENHLYRKLGYHLNGPEFENVQLRFTRGTPLSAAAVILAQKGLDVTIFHGKDCGMDNLHRGFPYYPEQVFPHIRRKYQAWLERPCAHLTQSVCGELTVPFLTDLLDRGSQILAMCFVDSPDGETLHGIILDRYSMSDGQAVFHVCNPATGNHLLEADELLRRMDTPVGVHFLSVNEA